MRDVPEELEKIAALARQSLQPGMPHTVDGQALGAGTCLHGALLVVLLLRKFAPVWRATVRGGGPRDSNAAEGALDAQGRWQGHYWVEARADDGAGYVVDITSDQFQFAPVTVLSMPAAAGRYRPGDQGEVDQAFAELVEEFGCAQLLAT